MTGLKVKSPNGASLVAQMGFLHELSLDSRVRPSILTERLASETKLIHMDRRLNH
jgi:hypothetical protein